jgi:chromatin modification-related protein VID21
MTFTSKSNGCLQYRCSIALLKRLGLSSSAHRRCRASLHALLTRFRRGRVFDVATLLRIPGFAPQQAKGSIEALDGSKPQISQANSPKTKALQTVPSKVRDVSLASNETTDSTQSLHPDHGRRDHGNDAMEGVCNDLDANHSGQGDSIDARSRDSRQDIARGSVGMPGATGQSKIVQDDIVPAGAGSSIPLSLEHTDDDSTIRLVPKPRKTHVLPSTPDAQLRLEAAQSESQTAGVSAEPAPIAPVSDHVSKAANGMTIKPDAAPLVQAKPSEDHTIAARRQGHQQDQRAATDTLGDVSANQRPPMRIDTTISRPQPSDESSTPAAALTPLKSGLQSSPPERMTTRVSSGALRHKSVSEILGETPKSAVHAGDRTPHDTSRESDQFTSRRSSLLASPESATKSRFGDFKDKDRSKLSTVVFARQQPGDQIRQGQGAGSSAARRIKSEEEKDYLVPLFAAQAQDQKPSLEELIRNSNKTLSTSNWYVQYQELHDCRILKRIYHLQNSNRWSLRQIERSAEPPRPTSHWDMLLNEMKWLRTDFREERKWKQAAAKNLAEACAEWVQTPEALRPSLQVRIKKPHPVRHAIGGNTTPVSTPNAMDVTSDGTPELIASAEDDMSDAADDLPMIDLSKANAPAALFALAPEDVLFDLDRTPAADKLLSELPLYQPFTIGKGGKQSHSDALDAAWRKPVVPVSKFALANLVSNDDGPPRKRSRYEYQEEEEAEFDSAGRALLPLDRKHGSLSPEQENVALFDPKNKHIISRLHAAHSFRPPSEFPMPTKAFFESRNPSQWTVAEDDELRRLVREYEYNWPLISASLASQSMFSSGAERRTPWECFERWESFEGLPGDMDKHSYFKAWKVRRQDARMHLEELYARQQQAGATAQMRRRNAEPVHVERRRNNKHLALIHAMSKVAKKKESAVQKQAHAASMAAMRKATEPSQKKLIIRTPREFSDHKHEQEVQFKEKQMLYRQQMQANQRVCFKLS